MTNPGHALESSIVNYLETQIITPGSLLSGSVASSSFYTGYNNLDKLNPPIVIVDATEFNELYFNTRNYEFLTKVFIKEMAFDTENIELGNVAQAVLNEFVNSQSASVNFSNTVYNINVWQVQTLGATSERTEDALITTAQFRIIGAMVPN